LREAGITRLVEVRTADPQILRRTVGSHADWLRRLAWGEDDRPVEPNRPSKSAGCEETYAQDLTDRATMRAELAEMARRPAAWLERHGLLARTITIKVRYDDFTTVTRSCTLSPTCDADLIATHAQALLDKTDADRRPVRLLGVSVHNLLNPQEPAREPDGILPFAL
jgi:DNA polymerase-4